MAGLWVSRAGFSPVIRTAASPQALALSGESMGLTTTGQIVNLLANDATQFDEVGPPRGGGGADRSLIPSLLALVD